MPHLVVETARAVLTRQLYTLPIELDTSTSPPAVVDILEPPAPLKASVPTALGVLRVRLVIEEVELEPVVGGGASRLAMRFDQGSVELLGTPRSQGLLTGTITVPFVIASVPRADTTGAVQRAVVVVSFATTTVEFHWSDASREALADRIGDAAATASEPAVGAALTATFRSIGQADTGLAFTFTPGVPSESFTTVEGLPTVSWVDGETLALGLRYAPEASPPPFPPVPFLPATPHAFGMRLSNDGFQRVVRNPAVRDMARTFVRDRRFPERLAQVQAERGHQGTASTQDRAEAAARVDAYLASPEGQAEVAAETPAPVGNGALHKHITDVPDPFSDFDVSVTEMDLWLGDGHIAGLAVASGEVNGFGFRASVTFRATPVLVPGRPPTIEMDDVHLDDPDVSIDLPALLEIAFGALVGVFAGPVYGVIAALLLSAVAGAVAETLVPATVPGQRKQELTGLPPSASLTTLEVVPDHLALLGNWYVAVDDPRPWYPIVRVVGDVLDPAAVGPARPGTAYLTCLGELGVIADAGRRQGQAFPYTFRRWTSKVRLTIEAVAVPLPLTVLGWTLGVGYRSPEQYHFPVASGPPRPLIDGAVTFTADVWHPEPPMRGRIATETFTIDAHAVGPETFELDVPADAACVMLMVEAAVQDAAGTVWRPGAQVLVPNETVTFDGRLDEFTKACAGRRREWRSFHEPSLLDQVWNPPGAVAAASQRALRAGRPGIVDDVTRLVALQGRDAFTTLLAPTLRLREEHG